MERIGYDADTMRYCFRDRDNSVWQGEEGSEFGPMTRGMKQSFHKLVACLLNLPTVNRLPSSVTPYHLHYHQQQQRSPTIYEPSFTEPVRATALRLWQTLILVLQSRPTADSSTSSQRSPTTYEPSFTEPVRATALRLWQTLILILTVPPHGW